MNKCGWELVASDEPSVLPKPLLDAMVMKNSQSNGRLADSTRADEGDGSKVFGQSDDLFDQLVTSETGPRRRWGWFARCGGRTYERLRPFSI